MKKSIVILQDDCIIFYEQVEIELWMDETDRESAITEFVINWCSSHGYSYDNDNISWDYQ